MNSNFIESNAHDQHRAVQERKMERNAAKVMQFEQAMFDSRSRHLILVLTLNYKPEYRHMVTFDLIREHRNRFINNRRFNQLLQDISGYVWKIEEGQNSGGLHLHVVLFYDGKHRADIFIAKCIGEYWANIVTQGMGSYRNSNAEKDKHKRYGHGVGTGQIDRNNDAKREALRQNLLYLTKDDQHVSMRLNLRDRTFGTSHLPERPSICD
jgi:hypothetical protein